MGQIWGKFSVATHIILLIIVTLKVESEVSIIN